ncbi:aminotransferase class V-fold PLP-dependent enzyme [Chloroflexota bacterium]
MDNLKAHFLLNPEIIYLNHGSFGACPRPVMEVYQAWQLELERQPVEFLDRRFADLLQNSRSILTTYLQVQPDEIVYFQNPTTAINMVALNLIRDKEPFLTAGDEILTTNHEYGAIDRTWRYICRQVGAHYVQREISLPVSNQDIFIDSIMGGVTGRTRVIFISHITSPTALTFPIAEICRRARQAGILTIVDGAHAPGQIELNLHGIDPDIYVGACHKWLCAPKGTSFLYARKDIQPLLDPLVISWGFESEKSSISQFIDYHEWQGTRDLSAFLTVPAAIEYQEEHDWVKIRRKCHAIAVTTRNRLNTITGLESICPKDWFHQMATIRLPQNSNLEILKVRLYDEFRIEVPVFEWDDEKFMRVSYQGYNSEDDMCALLGAVESLL